ncbi:MAG: hypothetical protein OEZ06_05150 [Myxococcales bacterium]|nr:hypothetical protein [Myxococcales bacterium]
MIRRNLHGLRQFAVLSIFGSLLGCTVGEVDHDFDGSFFDRDGGTAGDGAAPGPDAAVDGGGEPNAMADDDAGADPDPGDSAPTVEDLPRLFADAYCAALEDCMGQELLLRTFSGNDCRGLRQSRLENGEFGRAGNSVAAGLASFSAADVDDCLADIRALGCDAVAAREPVSCELTLLGLADLGADCTAHHDCSGDAFCDKGTAATCPGTCSALRAQDDTCNNNDNAECEDGLVCFDGSCQPLGELGDDCGDIMPACSPGLVCQAGICESNAVVYAGALDDACTPGSDLCQPGLYCRSDSADTGTCAEAAAEGGGCRRASPDMCPAHQYCDASTGGEDGLCTDLPVDAEGCLARTVQCAPGHTCVADICYRLKDNGESCDADSECYSRFCDAFICSTPRACTL